MKHGLTVEYLKCREDLNVDVNFRVNGVLGNVVAKLDLISLYKTDCFHS